MKGIGVIGVMIKLKERNERESERIHERRNK